MLPIETRPSVPGANGQLEAAGSKNILEDVRDPVEYLALYRPEPINSGVDFKGRSIVTVEQFGRGALDHLSRLTRQMRELVRAKETISTLSGLSIANLFYEPSSRTDASFQAAIQQLGGRVIMTGGGIQYSSVAKGESLADTIRTFACYASAIVLRHPKAGASYEAAYYAEQVCRILKKPNVPVISAGDGIGEHPTQGLLDWFTIVDEFGKTEGLKVVFVGDMKFGRTVHSLCKLLAAQDCTEMTFVSPESLRMPPELVGRLRSLGCRIEETTDLMAPLSKADVIYLTRVQKERFGDPKDYLAVKDTFVITPAIFAQAPKQAILMHPLPRVSEMGTAKEQDILDEDPRSRYFHQMENGMFVRMALLRAVIRG